MARTDRPGPGWYTANELAGFFGISRQSFADSTKKYSGAGESKRAGRTTFYQSRPLLERWADARHADTNGNGAEGPALERLRSEKALIAALDRKKMEGKLVDRSFMQEQLAAFAACIRNAADLAQRELGPRVIDYLSAGIRDFEKRLDRLAAKDLR